MKRIIVGLCVVMSVVSVQQVQASTSTTSGLSPTNREYTRLVAGDQHTCVVLHNGKVKCWGDNTYGQLGVEGIENSSTPVEVASFGNNRYAVEIAAGRFHNCALLNDSSISCWGENNFGSLGNGSLINPPTPVEVNMNGLRAHRVFAGGYTTCLLEINNDLYCWGRNDYQQLGTFQNSVSDLPTQVTTEHESIITSLSIGRTHICALAEFAVCWGNNTNGQLGDGTTIGGWPAKQVASFGLNSKGKLLAAGSAHSCVPLNTGHVKCWGNNGSGRLGDATIIERKTPSLVSGAVLFQDVEAGTAHSCGHDDAGSIFCWGSNTNGRLGNNSTQLSSEPIKVHLPIGVTSRQIALGDAHTCALLDNNEVMCWGSNSNGKLGDGTNAQRLVPTKVVQLRDGPGESVNSESDITHNAATVHAAFATRDVSSHRLLEYGTDEFLSGDTQTIDLGHFGSVAYIASGANHSCIVIAGGHVKCWGDNSDGALGTGDTTHETKPVDVQNIGGLARLVAVGTTHSCAVMATGSLKCWGDNSSGQLGDASLLSKTQPVSVNISGVVDAVLGDGFTCALQVGGTVSCWGSNSLGQLGRVGTSSSTPIAVTVDSDHTVMSLSASSSQICAVLSNATVKCWGEEIEGVAAPGTFTSSVADVSVAEQHACAVLHSGSVECWGDDSHGQLGDGDNDSSGTLVTSELATGDRAVTVSTAGDSTCAVLHDATMKCWGSGAAGTTGFGTTDNVHTPTTVTGIASVVQLSLAELHGCALVQRGEVWCWGSNSRQQRGTVGPLISEPAMMASHVNSDVSMDLVGLDDDTSYFYRIVTTSLGETTHGGIRTFNTLELPPPPIVDPPVADPPIENPVTETPDLDGAPVVSPPANPPTGTNPSGGQSITQPSSNVADTITGTETIAVVKKQRPSVKVGSLTGVRVVLRRLNFALPKASSSTKMWVTVMNKRICRVYGARLWAIRTGTCQLMVLKMGSSRRLTMSRSQIKVVR